MIASRNAQNFDWLINSFVRQTNGVSDALVVSSDGILIAHSATIEPAGAAQVAAIITGLVSLSEGSSDVLRFGRPERVIVTMGTGYLFVSSIADGSRLGVVATAGTDVGALGYQTGLLVERVGALLNPQLIAELDLARRAALGTPGGA